MNSKFLLNAGLLLCASLIATINASNDTQLQKREKAIKASKIAMFKRKKEKILNDKISPMLCKIGAPGVGENDFSHLKKLRAYRNSIDRQLKCLLLVGNRENFFINRDKLLIKFDEYKKSLNEASSDFLKIQHIYVTSVNQLPAAYGKLDALHETVNTLNRAGEELIKEFELLDKKIQPSVNAGGCLLIGMLLCGLLVTYFRSLNGYPDIN